MITSERSRPEVQRRWIELGLPAATPRPEYKAWNVQEERLLGTAPNKVITRRLRA